MPPRYADKNTERLANGQFVKAFSGIAERAERRLDQVVSATSLSDLRSLPGLRLESLKGNRAGQYSVRINDQYRVCFEWVDGEAVNIEVVDYH
ncbi:MAG TPA: type II toxin-antitoxin system RelE/ParE family toxin [Thermomicrobiales bacterium]|nr:type II toxin-antitoxin system RelE/ParE family toxin [Thermomicrobiales bacterium]